MPLTAYRRHLKTCPHQAKGQAFTLCKCPIWCYGTANGSRIRKSLGTNESAKAIKRMEALERGEGADDAPKVPTVAEASSAFLADCRSRHLKESTIDSYTKTLDHLTAAIGPTSVALVTASTLDAYRASREIAASTWRKELETIRAFFTFANERGWCAMNPARKLRMPRTEELVTQPFTADEINALIEATSKITSDDPEFAKYVRQRARALVYALLYTGLRISDIAALKRSSLEGKHLILRVTKTGVPIKLLLHKDALEALASLPAQNPMYFFWTGNGDIMTSIKNMRRTIQRLGAIAGVKAHPHRFRDTFAVELLTKEADIRTVQKLLGHSSVRTTEKYYAHFVAAHQALLDSAVSRLDFAAGGKTRPYPVVNRKRNA